MCRGLWLLLGMLALGGVPVNLAQAAPIFVAPGSGANGTGSVTVNWPTHEVDDVALLFVESTGGQAVTLSTAAGFVEITNSPQFTGAGTAGTRLTVFWARATSNSMASPTIADAGDHVVARILVYRGVIETGNPWNVTGGGSKGTASTAVSATGITTTVADTLVVVAVSQEVDTNTTAMFSGWTNANLTSLSEDTDFGRNSGNGGGFGVASGVKATAGATGATTGSTSNSTRNAFLTIALIPSATAPNPPGGFGLTQCAGDRFGSNLNCTANDVLVTQVRAVNAPTFCKAGDSITLDLLVTVNSGSPDRWDIGIFVGNDGKDPQFLSSGGGSASCTVAILPTTDPPFRDLDPGPHSGTTDTCGDVNGTMNPGGLGGVPQGSGVLAMNSTVIKCQAKTDGTGSSGGSVYVPFVVSWDNQSSPVGRVCASAAFPVPNTKSKCNTPTVPNSTIVGIIVMPKIEKSDGVTTIGPGQSTSYSVVITNNTGDTLAAGAVFKDPAVTNLTANSVTCSANGGATCPAVGDVTVANMQGAGITLPSMPGGSSLTFTVNATVAGGTPTGTTLTNTASITVQGQTIEASDTNNVGSTTLDHYELWLPADSVACQPSDVKVVACGDTSSPCTNLLASASGNATLSTNKGALGSTTPGFASGKAETTLTYTSATNGETATVTLSGVTNAAPNPHKCCPSGTNCVVANSCTTTFARDALYVADTSGGSVANIPTQTAGTRSGDFFVRSVITNADGTCGGTLSGANTIDFGYECNNPATCHPVNQAVITPSGGADISIPRNNNNAAPYSHTGVSLNFTNGYAPFSLIYDDVGLITLRLKNPTLAGASNPFVVKPANILLSGIRCTSAGDCAPGNTSSPSNPGAADETGLPFIKAGTSFAVNVSVVSSKLVGSPPAPALTPSFGKEAVPEGVRLTPILVSPNVSGANNPAIGNLTAFGTFNGGAATGTTFNWPEVGIIKLRPSIDDGNYLSAGNVIGPDTGNVGRFIPHHFLVTATPGCAGGATFTYSGQPFTASATARAATNTTTQNYRGSAPVYAKATTFSDATGVTSCTGTAMAASSYSAGIGSLSGITCTFPLKETLAQNLSMRAAENVGGDSVTSANLGDGAAPLRSGRVRHINAYGSELLDLEVPTRVEYYRNDNDGWILSTGDTCSSVGLKSFSNYKGNLQAGETCVQDTGNPGVSGQGCALAGPVAKLYTSPPVNSNYNLHLRAPGAGNDGSVDVHANLASMAWLRFNWTGAGLSDPTGTATFGTFRGNPRHIHLRELY